VERIPMPIIDSFEYKVKDLHSNELIKLTTYEYPSKGEAKAVLFYLTGYGDYCENYGYFFDKFAEAGIHVYAFDRRGFGNSEGQRGEIGEKLYEDHWGFFARALEHGNHNKNIPKYLYGYSFGGLIATRLCEQKPGYF
jgi:acylglycerol lipase